jgi:type IV pilus assembly protein PilY1
MIIAVFGTTNTLAGTNTLADAPLVTGLAKVISPNIFFILDDSGSMDSEYMPDGINTNSAKLCYRNFGYNTIYYNPATTYDPPLKSDGTSYANATFTAAYKNGYNTGSGTDDLSSTTSTPNYGDITAGTVAMGVNPLAQANNSRTVTVTHAGTAIGGHTLASGDRVTFTGLTGTSAGVNLANLNGIQWPITVTASNKYTFAYTNAQGSRASANTAAVGGIVGMATYVYTGVTSYTVTDNFYYAIYNLSPTSPVSTCSGDGNAPYTLKTATTYQPTGRTVAAEQTNFANWYSYYRTRLLMAKSSAGRAFSTVSDKYRVGFTTISDTGLSAGKSLVVKKFDATQKSDWYTKLYGISASSYTPLRGALSKAGRYYAGKVTGALAGSDNDPIQYSCQQNFTILTTDGYWNTNTESSSYGPLKEDNTTNVGDVDGSGVPRPQLDDKKISDTLADVAAYYYKTDLRPTTANGGLTDEGTHIDVASNNVPTSATDSANYQHMTTFTMGFGVDGTLKPPDKNGDNDLTALTQGTKVWPDPISSGEGPARIDDLWHAAIDGHGSYLSAKSPDQVEKGLTDMLQKIQTRKGSASAAATSNLQPVAGADNLAFIAQYQSVTWVGDLLARDVNPLTGVISATNTWSAQAKLDTQVAAAADTRAIYTFSSAATNKLKSFEPANLTSEKTAGYFKASQLSQNGGWTLAQKTAATDDALINYLRGQTGNEEIGDGSITDLFRDRAHALGDIANAAPAYVGKPPFSYLDTGYAAFLAANKSRAPVVYAGGNDGMLHAFDATKTGGKELWAYIPSMMIPNLYKLADHNYSDNHRFFVDGPIAVNDAYNGSTWSTVLVGGLGHGGRGYYALDVTDPANPKALWEFTSAQDSDLGYSYGNAVITKRASDDKWVVIVASGYNNSSPGDGKGRIFVLDAFTGTKLSEIITDSTVNDEQRSGIARINNYVDNSPINNVTQYVYGGDLDGALWRFDITASSNAGVSQLLGRTATAGTRKQPITVQPELAKIRDGAGNWHRVVYFGTGRYLGPNDITNSDPSNGVSQAVYAVVDTGASLGLFTSTGAKLVPQTLDTSATPRKINPLAAVDWQTNNGWYVATPNNERFNIDPVLQLGTLVMVANIPEQDYCHSTGRSIVYQFNYKSGNVEAANEYEEQIVGSNASQTNGGAGNVIFTHIGDDSEPITEKCKNCGAPGATGVTRVSWREIE